MLIPAGVFIVLLLGIFSAYWMFVVRHEQLAAGAVRKRLKSVRPSIRPGLGTGVITTAPPANATPFLGRLVSADYAAVRRVQALIEQSGVDTSLETLFLISATAAIVTYVGVRTFTGVTGLAIVAAAGASVLPVQFLRFKRARRLRTFEDQFPEALDLISRALRAGHAFTTGLEMVGTEMSKPIGSEFRLLYDRQNYGMALPDALKDFAQRVPILDAKFFVTAVLIQRESGGNLSEVLDNLSSVIRERHRVKRQMRVLSAHGRITGWVLVCLPPVLGLALMTINDEHRTLMFGDPLGIRMMIGAVVLQVIGTYIISRIVNVEY